MWLETLSMKSICRRSLSVPLLFSHVAKPLSLRDYIYPIVLSIHWENFQGRKHGNQTLDLAINSLTGWQHTQSLYIGSKTNTHGLIWLSYRKGGDIQKSCQNILKSLWRFICWINRFTSLCKNLFNLFEFFSRSFSMCIIFNAGRSRWKSFC